MIGVSKERDVLSNNRRKENVFSNNNSSKQRCDEHWYVNYVAGVVGSAVAAGILLSFLG